MDLNGGNNMEFSFLSLSNQKTLPITQKNKRMSNRGTPILNMRNAILSTKQKSAKSFKTNYERESNERLEQFMSVSTISNSRPCSPDKISPSRPASPSKEPMQFRPSVIQSSISSQDEHLSFALPNDIRAKSNSFFDTSAHAENTAFAEKRRSAHDGLSDHDRTALKLGRMVLSTVLDKPDVTTEDSISRFFLDNWLAKNGSTFAKADGLSVELICNIERAAANKCLTRVDDDAPVFDKSMCAVACEALDVLIKEFGDKNPVLNVIRSAFLPCLYTAHVDPVDKISDIANESKSDVYSRGLTGEHYLASPLWCEVNETAIKDLNYTRRLLDEANRERGRLEDENTVLSLSKAHCEQLQSQLKVFEHARTEELELTNKTWREKVDNLERHLHVRLPQPSLMLTQSQ